MMHSEEMTALKARRFTILAEEYCCGIAREDAKALGNQDTVRKCAEAMRAMNDQLREVEQAIKDLGEAPMTNANLHPWAATPEAAEAACKAVQIPLNLMPSLASTIARDELETQALVILTECALPPRDQAPTECAKCGTSLEGVRKGAKFCGPDCRREYAANVPEASESHPRGATGTTGRVPPAYVGSMYSWPEDDMGRYAMREIGYALMNWLRISHSRP